MKYYCFYICCLFFRSLLGKSWWYLYTVKDSQEKLSSPFSLSLCHTQTCMVLAVQCLSENNSSLTTSSLWLHRAIRGTPVVVRAVWVHFMWIFFFLSRTFPLFPLLLCCQSTRFTWAAAFAFCFWWPVSMLWFSHAGSYKPAGPAVVLMTCPSEHSCYY